MPPLTGWRLSLGSTGQTALTGSQDSGVPVAQAGTLEPKGLCDKGENQTHKPGCPPSVCVACSILVYSGTHSRTLTHSLVKIK